VYRLLCKLVFLDHWTGAATIATSQRAAVPSLGERQHTARTTSRRPRPQDYDNTTGSGYMARLRLRRRRDYDYDTSTAAPPATRLTHGVESGSLLTSRLLRCISQLRHIHSSTSSDPSDARRGGGSLLLKTTSTLPKPARRRLRPRLRPRPRLRLRLRQNHSSTSSDPSDARRGGWLASFSRLFFLRWPQHSFDTATATPLRNGNTAQGDRTDRDREFGFEGLMVRERREGGFMISGSWTELSLLSQMFHFCIFGMEFWKFGFWS
jgi:hypothetical protein